MGANKIAAILRETNGHAGQAAAAIRDLCGTGKREVDPDDQEHVRTLLTSPAMFAAVCQENFRKFDVNADGVLSWSEVLPLVNTLYEGFGLQLPREGNLRAFFDATDLNKDGVLSEQEFQRFFECFLRYAFFDVVQKDHKAQQQRQAQARSVTNSVVQNAPSSAACAVRQVGLQEARPPKGQKSFNEQVEDTSASPGHVLRVIAPHGVSRRRTPEMNDCMDETLLCGQVVQVLEHWVKTDQGWLPVHDAHGKLLLQPTDRGGKPPAGAAMSACRHEKCSKEASPVQASESGAGLGSSLCGGEEEWRDRFERLQERFPMLSSAQVLQKLRANQGHAGHTAAALRELAGRQGGN